MQSCNSIVQQPGLQNQIFRSIYTIRFISGFTRKVSCKKWIQEHRRANRIVGQELQKAYPQFLKQNEQGILSVNYSGMIPVLLEAIKELKKENEEQQKQINALKNK